MIELKRKISNLSKNILLFLSLIVIFLAFYIKKSFGNVTFEQLLYSVENGEGTSINAIKEGIIFVLSFSSLFFVIIKLLIFLANKFIKINCEFILNVKNKSISLFSFPLSYFHRKVYTVIFFFLSLLFFLYLVGCIDYLKSQLDTSYLFEKYYVNPKSANITAPDEKTNLIYIYVESLETSLVSSNNGGLFNESIIPNLENLALNNINFSNTNNLGGALQLDGTGWTAAALISQTSAIPLKLTIDGNSYKDYGKSLPGAYSLGEILEENGYNNYFLLGSDSTYGGRKDYFTYHGDYTIFDYYWAVEKGKISEDYFVWWGYEDAKLYVFAKEQLLDISKNDEPFNFTMLTADTHFIDGYLDDSCPAIFDSHYANSFYCTDIMLNNFINWVKEQDFYDNTVIVITGDHLTMQSGFYDENSSNKRVVFNTFINSKVSTDNSKNRQFTTMDMFPTTLGALGFTIEGDRLGLGTNLFSNSKTLVEELGYDYLSNELDKSSNYYNRKLLGSTYYEMLKDS